MMLLFHLRDGKLGLPKINDVPFRLLYNFKWTSIALLSNQASKSNFPIPLTPTPAPTLHQVQHFCSFIPFSWVSL